MPQTQLNKAILIILIIPLMSLNSGQTKVSKLDKARTYNDNLRKEIVHKEHKREVIEAQINYKDSIDAHAK